MHVLAVPTLEVVGIRGEEGRGRRVCAVDLKPLCAGEVAEPGNGLKGHICPPHSSCEVVTAAAGQDGVVTAPSEGSSSVAARWWLV
jgi:hypothetical protein